MAQKKRSKQLGYGERLKIEMLYKTKFGVKGIAAYVNKSERTIYRELKIGKVELRNSDYFFKMCDNLSCIFQ